MKLTASRKTLMLALPFRLLPRMALMFTTLSRWLGADLGYVLGFVVYWGLWCLLVPWLCLGTQGLLALFAEETPLFSRANWSAILVLILILAGTLAMYPITNLVQAPLRLLLLAVPIASLNGIFEEILWRGLYLKVFPRQWGLGLVFPALGFAAWHLAPQLVYPAEGGRLPFVVSTFFLGLAYGWIARQTGSVRWTALSHSFSGIWALGGAIVPSLARLWFH